MKRSRALAAAVVVVSLAACGGGQSGYAPSIPPAQSTSPQSTPTPSSGAPTPPSETSPAPVSTQTPAPGGSSSPAPSSSPATAQLPPVTTDGGQQAQALQGSALAGLAGSLSSITGVAGMPSTTVFGAYRFARAMRRMSSGCSNQETQTQTTAGAMTTYVLKGYPNAACSGLPEYQMDLNMYANGSSSFVGNGLESFYDPSSGATLAQNTIEYISASTSSVQIEGSFAAYTATGQVTSAYGLTCFGKVCGSATAINASAVGVSFGSVVSSNGCGCTTVLAYVAPLNDLSVQLLSAGVSSETLPFYQINGGVNPDDVTLTLTSNGYDMIDKSNGAEVQVTTNADGAASGIILDTSTKKQLASFNMDQFGAGTLTTSDGTQTPIAGFMVL